jgi:hypothetical protein
MRSTFQTKLRASHLADLCVKQAVAGGNLGAGYGWTQWGTQPPSSRPITPAQPGAAPNPQQLSTPALGLTSKNPATDWRSAMSPLKAYSAAEPTPGQPEAPGAPPTPPLLTIGGSQTEGSNIATQAKPNPERGNLSAPASGVPGGFGGMGQTGNTGTGAWHTAQIDPAVGGMPTRARQGTLDAISGKNFTDWNNAGTSGTFMSQQKGGNPTATGSISRQVDASGNQTGAQIKSQYGTGSSTTIPTAGTPAYDAWANSRSFTNDQGQTFKGPDAMQKGVGQIAAGMTTKAQDAAGTAARAANPSAYNTAEHGVTDPNGQSQFSVAQGAGLITPQQTAGIAAAGKTNMPAAPTLSGASAGAPPAPSMSGSAPGAPPPTIQGVSGDPIDAALAVNALSSPGATPPASVGGASAGAPPAPSMSGSASGAPVADAPVDSNVKGGSAVGNTTPPKPPTKLPPVKLGPEFPVKVPTASGDPFKKPASVVAAFQLRSFHPEAFYGRF